MVQDDIVAKVEPSLKQTTYNKAKRPLPHLESMAFCNVYFLSLVFSLPSVPSGWRPRQTYLIDDK